MGMVVIIAFLPKMEQDTQSQITQEQLHVQQLSLGKIWDNPEEDIYGGYEIRDTLSRIANVFG